MANIGANNIYMIRLNKWRETTDENQPAAHRLSDILPDVNLRDEHVRTERTPNFRLDERQTILKDLEKRQLVEDIHFWTSFRDQMDDKGLFLKVTQPSSLLTVDKLRIKVIDEFDAPCILYLSLEWMRQQATLDRPAVEALNGKTLNNPQMFAPEDVIWVYDCVRSGEAVFAKMFTFCGVATTT